ncbi:D-inositol-3-phosphate glycosyltransferase [compost metagenome]
MLSSAWEGFGLVVAEAMACQRIAVCTDAGGIKEVIGDVNFVVPVADYKALADKILQVDSLSAERKSVIEAQNRRHVINNFSITSVVDRWLEIYTAPQVDK